MEGETNELVWEAEGQTVNCAAGICWYFHFPGTQVLCFSAGWKESTTYAHLTEDVNVPSFPGCGRHHSRILTHIQVPERTRRAALAERELGGPAFSR